MISQPLLRTITIPESLDKAVIRLARKAGVPKSDMLVTLLEEGMEITRAARERQELSMVDYVAMATASMVDPALAGILSRNGAAHLTVCPVCHIDDFCHAEPCPVLYELDEIGKTI